jgi:hypothetical protein
VPRKPFAWIGSAATELMAVWIRDVASPVVAVTVTTTGGVAGRSAQPAP